MKKVVVYLLISLMIISVTCFNNTIILPENINELYEYKWQEIQLESEPDCFLFLDNGRLEISGFTNRKKHIKWSYNNDEITIHYDDGDKSYVPEIYEDNGIKYLKLGDIEFRGIKLMKNERMHF